MKERGTLNMEFNYRDSLIGTSYLDWTLPNTTNLEEFMLDDEDDEEEGEEDYAIIKLSSKEKKCIHEPWHQTLIVKGMGHKIEYTFLLKWLQSLWKIRGELGLVNLVNDFFLAKLCNQVDIKFALFGSPWMILDHYHIVRQWHLNFGPYKAAIEKVAIWVDMLG